MQCHVWLELNKFTYCNGILNQSSKEAQIEKGSQTPGQEFVGDINIDQAIKIAEILKNKIRSKNVRSALSQVIGTCVSMGIKIDSQHPKEASKLLISGSYNDKLGEIKNWVLKI